MRVSAVWKGNRAWWCARRTRTPLIFSEVYPFARGVASFLSVRWGGAGVSARGSRSRGSIWQSQQCAQRGVAQRGLHKERQALWVGCCTPSVSLAVASISISTAALAATAGQHGRCRRQQRGRLAEAAAEGVKRSARCEQTRCKRFKYLTRALRGPRRVRPRHLRPEALGRRRDERLGHGPRRRAQRRLRRALQQRRQLALGDELDVAA